MPPRLPRTPRPNPSLLGSFAPRHAPRVRSTAATTATQGRGGTAFADAVSEALFGRTAPVVPPEPEPGDPPMRPTVGSILQFTPDARGWTALMSNDRGEQWQEAIVGWAVVVIWVAYTAGSEGREEGDESEFQTDVQPVLFTYEGSLELMMFRDDVTLEGLIMPGQIEQPGPKGR